MQVKLIEGKPATISYGDILVQGFRGSMVLPKTTQKIPGDFID
jgi:hypothetical protein